MQPLREKERTSPQMKPDSGESYSFRIWNPRASSQRLQEAIQSLVYRNLYVMLSCQLDNIAVDRIDLGHLLLLHILEHAGGVATCRFRYIVDNCQDAFIIRLQAFASGNAYTFPDYVLHGETQL